MAKEYANWKDYPMKEWRWPNFKPSELQSKGDGKLMVDPDSMDKLQALRILLGKPMHLTSAYRSPEHNKRVGGAKNSQHLKAKAFDVQMRNLDPAEFFAAATVVGFTGFGFYEKQGFIHVDTGPKRTWNNRWFEVSDDDVAKLEAKIDSTLAPPEPDAKAGLIAFIAKLFGGKK